MSAPPPFLADELVEEVLLRLPPEDPSWLVRSSAVCKPWRRILAAPRFRHRYREFHGTLPLLGYFKENANFVPTSALLPAQPKRLGWIALDCRHGRALLAPSLTFADHFDFIVLDPVTGHQIRVPYRPYPVHDGFSFSAAVLCAAQGCDHQGCQGEHFLVALVSTDWSRRVTSGWLYSSETRAWSELTSVHHPAVECSPHRAARSVLVGDALYFNIDAIIKCKLGTRSLSVFEKPFAGNGRLMTAEDGGLGFAAVVNVRYLTLWSMEAGPEGAIAWTRHRVIDLEMQLPDGALSILPREYWVTVFAFVSSVVEGTQVIFVTTYVGCYMVDLKSGRARKVPWGENTLPYMRFYIPAMEIASTDQEQ